MKVLPTILTEEEAESAVYTTDKHSRYSGRGYLQCYTRPEMVSIYLDDPEPPQCSQCGKLAREICRNCHQLYCVDHRGGSELCQNCSRSSLMTLAVAGAALLLVGLFLLVNLLR